MRVRAWRLANPDKVRQQARDGMRRRRRTGDQKVRDRQWVKNNPEKRAAIQKRAYAKFYALHREELIARSVSYKQRKRKEALVVIGKVRIG